MNEISSSLSNTEERRQQYRFIFEAASDGMIINDIETGCVVEVNPAALAMHGYTRAEFIGLHLTLYIHPDSQSLFIETAHAVPLKKTLLDVPVLHLRKDGSAFNVDVRRTFIPFRGRPCMLSVIRDISERINSERLLHEREESHAREQATLLDISQTLASAFEFDPILFLDQLRMLIEYTHAELFLLEQTNMVSVAERGLQQPENIMPLRISLKGPETLIRLFNQHKAEQIADVWSDEPSAQFLRSLLADQTDLLLKGVHAWMWVPIVEKKRVIGIVSMAHVKRGYFTMRHADLALTMANQAAIALVNAELYEHAQALAVLQERQRLAQNLHDAVNQSLFSAGLIADVLPRLWERDPDEARKSLVDLRRLTRAAQAEMRSLLAELHPTALTDTDLGDLLRLLGNALSGRINIPVTVTVPEEVILPPEAQLAFYRISQEALNNIAKYSKASHAYIDLVNKKGVVELHVRDDGLGFDTESPLAAGHYGLGIMHERAEAIAAQLTITSHPGQGTEIVLRWLDLSNKETA